MLKLSFCFLAVGSLALLQANPLTPCAANTLLSYQDNTAFPTNGCSIGVLDYFDFSYHAVSNAPSASAIEVTPSGQGFSFSLVSGAPFTASVGQVVQFEIDYNVLIDPAPILGGGDLSLDPPSGNVSVTEYYCNDGVYVYTGQCFGIPLEKLTVGTIPPLTLSASLTFANPATRFQETGILFTLDGTNGPSSFDGLDTDLTVVNMPEPNTGRLAGAALASTVILLAARARRRLNRSQS
jgi:hypothetical protein